MTFAIDEIALYRILDVKRKFGFPTEEPTYEPRLEKFQGYFAEKFGAPLPEEVVDFLAFINGLSWNGITFYGVDEDGDEDPDNQPFAQGGILSQNLTEASPSPTAASEPLFLGEAAGERFVYLPEKLAYVVLDASSAEVLETYPSFHELIDAQMARMLAPDEEES